MKDGTSLETWEAYFPVKLSPAFLALLWEELHRDVKEMLFYRKRGDFAKLRSLKKIYKRGSLYNEIAHLKNRIKNSPL